MPTTATKRNVTRLEPLESRRLLSASLGLDPSFAGDGRAEFELDGFDAAQVEQILVSDGGSSDRIYALGTAVTRDYDTPIFSAPGFGGQARPDLAAGARFVAELSPDGQVLSLAPLADAAPEFALYEDYRPDPTGKFFASRLSPDGAYTVRRFNADLSPDPSFAPVTVPAPSSGGAAGFDYDLTEIGFSGYRVLVGAFGDDNGDAQAQVRVYDDDGVNLPFLGFEFEESGLSLSGNADVQGFTRIFAQNVGNYFLLGFSGSGFEGGPSGSSGGAVLLQNGPNGPARVGGYGDDGDGLVTTRTDVDGATRYGEIWAEDDGRVAIYNRQDDGVADLYLFDEEGSEVTKFVPAGPGAVTGFATPGPSVADLTFLDVNRVAYVNEYSVGPFDLIFGERRTQVVMIGAGGGSYLLPQDRLQPAEALSLAVAPDGDLLVGGFVEALDLTQLGVLDGGQSLRIDGVENRAAVWKLGTQSATASADVTIGFENVPPGGYSTNSNPYPAPAGFVVADKNASKQLTVLGASAGYPSRVARPQEWGGTILLERADGQAFCLDSFDYVANQWSEAGDLVATGFFADGTTDSASAAFSSKLLQALDLDWTGLTRVEITFAGGVNPVYGVVDNLALVGGDAGGTDGGDAIRFDNAAPGDSFYKYERDDFNVFARTPSGGGQSTLDVVADDAGGAAVKSAFGGRVRVTRDMDRPFDLDSVDVAPPSGFNVADFTVRAKFADGTFSEQSYFVAGAPFGRIDLGLEDVVRVDFIAAGGQDDAPPVLDDLAVTPRGAAGVADFEQFAPGVYPQVADAGATFVGVAGGGATTGLNVYGPAQGYASQVVSTVNWGESVRISHGGLAFNLASLALAAGRWGEAGDALITGRRADGTSVSTAAAFDSKIFSTVQLAFDDVVAVEVAFGGGANDAYGAIDDVVFA